YKSLRNQHDGRLPERGFLSHWIQHCHLTGILARWKLRQRQAEPQRKRLRLWIQPIDDLNRCCLKCFRLTAIKRDECDHRLSGSCVSLVGLQINVHVASLTENPSHAWNQPLPFNHKRIHGLSRSRELIFTGIE